MKILNGPRKGERGRVALCVCTNLFVKSWFRSFNISMFFKISFVKNIWFSLQSSSEVINDIINGFVGYITARNDIKHVRVIYSMAYIWYFINSKWPAAAILVSENMKVIFVNPTSKTPFVVITKRFRFEIHNKSCF